MSRLSESSDDSPGPGSPTWPGSHWPTQWPTKPETMPSFHNQSKEKRQKTFSDESDESDEPPQKKLPIRREPAPSRSTSYLEPTPGRSTSYLPSLSPPSSSPSGSPTKEPPRPPPPKVEMTEERKQLIIRLDNFFKARYTENDEGYEREISTPDKPPPILPEFQGRSYRGNRQQDNNRRYNR